MRFDKSLVRTVLFSLTVVLMVIGVYQTVLQNDANAVRDNYWLFTLGFATYLIYWYLGRGQKSTTANPPPAATAPRPAPRPARNAPAKRRRSK